MTGSVSGADAQTLSLGSDFSHWDGDYPSEYLKHLDFAWFKACDGDQLRSGSAYDYSNYVDVDLSKNIQKAWDADIPCGLYIYVKPVYPNWTIQSLIDHHYKALKAATKGRVAGVSYHKIAIDIEERGQTDVNLAGVVKGLADKILADPEYAAVTGDGIVIYTRNSYLTEFPALLSEVSNPNVLGKYQMWLAQWPLFPGQTATDYKAIETTWDELYSKYIPLLNMRVSTPGFQTCKIVQWSACFKIAGSSFRFDLNFFMGSKTACWNWFKYVPRGVVVTPPPDSDGGGTTTPPPADTTGLQQQIDALKVRVSELEAFKQHVKDA